MLTFNIKMVRGENVFKTYLKSYLCCFSLLSLADFPEVKISFLFFFFFFKKKDKHRSTALQMRIIL